MPSLYDLARRRRQPPGLIGGVPGATGAGVATGMQPARMGTTPVGGPTGGPTDVAPVIGAQGGTAADYTGMAATAGLPGTYFNPLAPSVGAPTSPATAIGNPPSPVPLPPDGARPPYSADPAVGNLLNGAVYDNSPEALARAMEIRNRVPPGAGIINPGLWGGGGPGGGPTGPMDPVNVGTNMAGHANLPQHAGNGHDMGQTQQGDARNGPHRDPNWRPPAFDWTAYANGQPQPHNEADWAGKFLPGTTGRGK